MANYNKVILAGNLTREPQLSFLPSNTPVCEFGMAINHRWRGQDGQQRESTCFVDCRLYGRSAETFNQYMSKGRSVLVEGRLDFQQWETPEGQKRSKHMVFVQSFQFLGGRGADASDAPPGRSGGYAQADSRPGDAQSAPGPRADAAPRDDGPPPLTEDGIPF